MRLLIVRLSSMGDIVHALPLAANARAAGATVGWLTDRQYGGLLEGNPSLARVFLADTRRWRRNPFSPAHWREVARLRRSLRDFAPDATVDVQGLWKSALLARMAGAPVVSFSAAARREPTSAVLVSTGVGLGRAGGRSARPQPADGPGRHGIHPVARRPRSRARAAAARCARRFRRCDGRAVRGSFAASPRCSRR